MDTFGDPCCLNMQPFLSPSIEAAVFNKSSAQPIFIQVQPTERERQQERAWPFFFLAAVQHSCGFLGGQRDKAKKTWTVSVRERERERKRQKKEGV